ncbi:transglycosylase family protein [Streptomyces sp. NPDC002855]|uniref:transglycosylase family protein n=1 Tax=Streptomyces sp. NPDC002855 TaxID=3154437 RepID=UPI003316EB64
MLSGNGRHRRPRQAPALIVAAGVAGSAIAIPLLGATSASAADTATWDKLAECESGGSWSADAGNGYYGGLQFSQQVWEEYGGLDFAPSADLASRSQQISVAEKVLDDQGTSAWPSCAPIAGLTQDGAAADVDPGAPITTIPSDESTESGESAEPDESDESDEPSKSPSESADSADGTKSSDKPSDKSSGKPSADDADADADARDKNHDEPGNSGESDDPGKSGQSDETSPTPTPSSGAGEGRHRGDSADDKPSDDTSREGSGRHASRGEERQQDGSDGTYTVRSGDSLSLIADDLDVKGGWTELYSENEKSVGSDPDLILPGQSLDLGEK